MEANSSGLPGALVAEESSLIFGAFVEANSSVDAEAGALVAEESSLILGALVEADSGTPVPFIRRRRRCSGVDRAAAVSMGAVAKSKTRAVDRKILIVWYVDVRKEM